MVQLGAIAEYVYERPGDTLVNQATKFDLVWIEDAVALEDKAQARTTGSFACSIVATRPFVVMPSLGST